MKDYIVIIGGGLAGTEAAYQIAKRGIKVKLYEMKPKRFSGAHSNENLAEIVCSNSFKSNLLTNACGLLKQELRMLDSINIQIADKVSVPAGQALAVDREDYAKEVTKKIKELKNVEIIREEVGQRSKLIELVKESIVVIASGPLTSDALSKEISELINKEQLYFYDAAAPIIEKTSINMDIAFYGNRYEQQRELDEEIEDWKKRLSNQDPSYINLPMNKDEYEMFIEDLITADVVELHEFEKKEIFEGCMPIEIMAKRGKDTLRFGPLKPVGFTDPRIEKRPYAIIQLRQDNKEASIYNMVGFQTNLKFGEQKRVFSKIPGLENSQFTKLGVMHRNTFIDSPNLIDKTGRLKEQEKYNRNIFFAGQITGVEGYVESIASGLLVGINASKLFNSLKQGFEYTYEEYINNSFIMPKETMLGAITEYIVTENKNFQPMNANFGIMPQLEEKIKDKKLKYKKISDISINALTSKLEMFDK